LLFQLKTTENLLELLRHKTSSVCGCISLQGRELKAATCGVKLAILMTVLDSSYVLQLRETSLGQVLRKPKSLPNELLSTSTTNARIIL
jgi:hypothetical protein